MSLRYYIFLKDVLVLALTSFGGPQAHVALMFKMLVDKRHYISEKELIELNALCQILPGPTSTQTITALGYKIGGANLAYLTLLVWITPAATIMTLAGLGISYLQQNNISLGFLKFIQPMAVGFVAYAAYMISSKVVNTKLAIGLMVVSAIIGYFYNSPWVYPLLLIGGGVITAFRFKQHPEEMGQKLKIQWANFVLYVAVLVTAAVLGGATSFLPIRLFENFYRNGSLVFGGGQVLIPLMYTEFVDFKKYLSAEEFLSGFAIVQALPGPVFAYCSYIGSLAMRGYGIPGQLLGSFVATVGIFLPGTFLIFFVIRFWDGLKKFRVVRASLEGVSAVSSGMVVSAAIMLYHPIDNTLLNLGLVIATFCLLLFTKIPPPVLILTGLLMGFLFG
ncbi:chromate efflux transporter [Pontibacter qinzhouensis]|uniref:Chromate efflux transporter n=1 Tax=Pontibacter qinzhouensis TaxID=2603253 RepID=A0A5C8KEP4_9BACT|nr:chromate efflux transporter [Pontibacter qinzhouensis]TXK52863.1 chromate efflux transporter [Pontibacter qinzhouensis]